MRKGWSTVDIRSIFKAAIPFPVFQTAPSQYFEDKLHSQVEYYSA